MPKILPYAAQSVYDPPIYAQAIKVEGAQTFCSSLAKSITTPTAGAPILATSRGRRALLLRR